MEVGDGVNRVADLAAPPMSEGVADCGGKLAVLFESSALKYRPGALFPQEHLQFLSLDAFHAETP